MFPTTRYRADNTTITVANELELDALGSEWADSPADYGVETCPGPTPDPLIAARRAELAADAQADAQPDAPQSDATPDSEPARKRRK